MSDLNKIRDDLAEKFAQGQASGCADTSFFAYKCFVEGFDAALRTLAESAGEFSKEECYAEAARQGFFAHEKDIWYDGHRRQFEQDRARIGLAELNAMSKHADAYEAFRKREAELTARAEKAEYNFIPKHFHELALKELQSKLAAAEGRIRDYEQNLKPSYEAAAVEAVKLQARVKELEAMLKMIPKIVYVKGGPY